MTEAGGQSTLTQVATGAALSGLLLVSLLLPFREPDVRAVIWSSSTGAWADTAPLREQRGPDLHQLDDGTLVVGDPRDGQAYELGADRWHPTDVFVANPFPPWNPAKEPLPAELAHDLVMGGRWPDGAMLAMGKRGYFKAGAGAEWTPIAAGPKCDHWEIATADTGRALLLCRGLTSKLYAVDVSAGTWTPVIAPSAVRFGDDVWVGRLTDARVMVLATANERRLLPLPCVFHALGALAGLALVALAARTARSAVKGRAAALLGGALFSLVLFGGYLLVRLVMSGLVMR